MAPVMSRTAASEFTSQCETSSARLRVDEGAGEPRQRLGSLRAASGSVAGRENHPIHIELEPGDFGRGEVAVVLLAGRHRRRQQQARLGIALHLPRQRAMRREMHDSILRKLARLAPTARKSG